MQIHTHPKYKYYKFIILPVVLYGCETWSLTFMEEYRLRVFDNRVLRVDIWVLTADGRKVHNEELCALYSSPNIIRVI
jgi:hypothetical protein